VPQHIRVPHSRQRTCEVSTLATTFPCVVGRMNPQQGRRPHSPEEDWRKGNSALGLPTLFPRWPNPQTIPLTAVSSASTLVCAGSWCSCLTAGRCAHSIRAAAQTKGQNLCPRSVPSGGHAGSEGRDFVWCVPRGMLAAWPASMQCAVYLQAYLVFYLATRGAFSE
jgi:hypothetical protein